MNTSAAELFINESKLPASTQQILCQEIMLRENKDREWKSPSGPAVTTLRIKEIGKQLKQERRSFEHGQTGIKFAKAGTKLAITGANAFVSGLMDATGLGKFAKPISDSVMSMFGEGVGMVSDAVYDSIIKDREEKFSNQSASFLREHFESTGVTETRLRELEGKPLNEIHQALLDPGKLFGPDSRLSDVPKDLQGEMLFQFSKALDARQNDLASITQARMDNIEDDVKGLQEWAEGMDVFKQETVNRLQGLEAEIGKVHVSLEEVKHGLEMVNDRVSTNAEHIMRNGRAINALQGAVFSQLPPSEQLKALRSGFFQGMEQADRNELKQSILAAQARQKVAQTFGKLSAGSALVGRAAEVLGLPEDVQRIADVASGVFNAVSAAASGNYIGAAMQVLGFFGKKKEDPASKRHKQVMERLEYLAQGQQRIMERQKEIYQRQADIMKNQQVILEAVGKLAHLIERNHAEVMEKLAEMQGDILRNRALIIRALCQGLDAGAAFLEKREEYGYVDGKFPSYSKRLRHYSQHASLFKQAWQEFTLVFNASSIHPFLLMESWDSQVTGYNSKEWREKMVTPALRLFSAANTGSDYEAAVVALTLPSRTVDSQEKKVGDVAKAMAGHSHRNLDYVRAHFHKPLSSKMVLEYGRVVMGLQGYFPLMKVAESGQPDGFEMLDFVEACQSREFDKRGKHMLKSYLRTLDLCIAQHAVLAGETIVPHICKVLEAGPSGNEQAHKDAVSVLQKNHVLRHNVAMYWFRQELPKTRNNPLSYGFACNSGIDLKHLVSDRWKSKLHREATEWTPVEKDVELDRPVNERVYIWKGMKRWTVEVADGLKLQLPHPSQLNGDEMLQLQEMPQLLAMRQEVASALVDSRYGKWCEQQPQSHKQMLAVMMLRAAQPVKET